MSAWAAKLPRLCRYTAPHEAMIVYNLSLYLEANGWKFIASDAGSDDGDREAIEGATPEERAQDVADLVGEVDDLKAYTEGPDGARSWMLLIAGNGVDVISDYGVNMSKVMDGYNVAAAHLMDDRSTHEVLGIALAKIAELEALLNHALPIIDAYRRVSGGDGDVTAQAIRTALSGNRALVPG